MVAETCRQLTDAEQIADHLRLHCRGCDNRRFVSDLAASLQWDERRVRQAITDAGHAGAPIVANSSEPRGVWWGTQEEARESRTRKLWRGLHIAQGAWKDLKSLAPTGQFPLIDMAPELLQLLEALETNDTTSPLNGGEAHVVEITAEADSAGALPADGPDSPGAATGAGPGSRAGGGQPGRAQLTFLDSGPGHCRDSAQGPAGDWPGG